MTFSRKNSLLCVLTLLAIFSLQSTECLRILGLFPFQARSHFVMCEELMRGLAARGHQVDVYSPFPLREPVQNYKDFSLVGTLPALENNITFDTLFSISTPLGFISNTLRESSRSLCELLDHPHFRKLRDDPPKDPPYDLIVMEFSQSHCYIPWGRYLKVPVIGVVTLPTLDWIYTPQGSQFNLATDPSVFSRYSSPMTFFERLSNVITYYSAALAFSYVIREQDKRVKEFFGSDYPNNEESVKDFSLILLNQNLALNGIRTFAPSIVPVGGLHVVDRNKSLPQELQKWLDESTDGCIYFSFGSIFTIETFPKHILKSLYKSFVDIAPVRVLLRITKPELLPANLPPNVFTQPWFPQIQVLKHKNIKAFVTHGGLMGSQESIYFGVPMVVIPLFGDQPLNADSYEKRKIAVKVNLDEINEKTFTTALKEVLKNSEYKKAAEKLSSEFRDRPMSPIDTAAFWIEYISRHGKNALKSPIVDMSWWQACLLDVYCFIAAAIVTMLYIMKKIVNLISLVLRDKSTTRLKKNN